MDPTHVFNVGAIIFEIDAKYELIKEVGKGAYGVVCSCRDKTNNTKIAVKKVAKCFADPIDAKRTLREIKLLRHLDHENIIPLIDLQPVASKDLLTDVYEITALMDTDLHQIIRSPQPLSDEHTQYFIYQLLCALKYIHSASVMHRDLKPGNLLVNRNCDLKVCDFGLARFSDDPNDAMTEYVVTRWYRAPELILTKDYNFSIDMWSTGCILAELLGRKPIFQGKDYLNQLECIIDITGTPIAADMTHVVNKKAREHILKMKSCKKQPFKTLYPDGNEHATDLLEKILQFDPSKRLTAAQALEHPYFAPHHVEEMEPQCPSKFSFDFEFEAGEDADTDYKALIWDEVLKFHPECR